jgi:hypothetical protein
LRLNDWSIGPGASYRRAGNEPFDIQTTFGIFKFQKGYSNFKRLVVASSREKNALRRGHPRRYSIIAPSLIPPHGSGH